MEELGLAELSIVEFPDMRENVISAVRALADREYQERVWIQRIYPEDGYFDDFTLNINILYDDTLVLEDPASALGTILSSQQEVAVLTVLRSALDELLEREGTNKSDAEYLASPLWSAVVDSASAAYRILADDESAFSGRTAIG
ncbi:SCO4402 family protein [Streptomyces sp. NPDC001975]